MPYTWLQVAGSVLVGTVVGSVLYRHQSPFAQKRHELGRQENPGQNGIVQFFCAGAVGWVIATLAKSGQLSLITPWAPLYIGLSLAALATMIELPNALTENRSLYLFALNRVHDVVLYGTIAAIIKQFV